MKQLLLFSGLLAWMFPAALLAQPYNVDWEDLTRMTVSGADLTSTSGGAMARSAFVLPSSTDGYVEFDAGSVNHSIYLGFGEHPNYTLDKDDIEFGVKLNADDQIFSWESGTETLLGSFVSTDVIRVERIGSKVYYKKNGTTLSSSTVSTGKPWDFSVYSTNSGETITDIQSDFNSYPVNASFAITNEDYSNNSSGAIDMTVSGASGPYTYAWSTSATTDDITGLGAGIYTVTITDGSARTYTHKVSVGYTPEWIDLVKMNQTGSTLSSTWGFYSSATSTNILWENEDGWVEFTLPSGTYTNYSFGLTEYPNNDYTYFDINYGFNLLSNGLCRVAELNTYTNITSYNSDDVFRIERVGSTIYYYRNGVEVRSVSVDPTEKLVVDFCTKQTGATLSAVRTSYDKKAPQISYSITPETSANQSAGAIDITVSGNTDPYTYNWTPGNITTEDLSNLAGGNYQLSLTDNASRVYTSEAGAGYEIAWTGLVNATANGGSVTLNASNYGGVAYSEQSLGANQDGWVEYTIVNNNVPNDFIGFSVAPNTTGSYVNMDYALNFTQNGATYYQAGFGLKTLTPYAVGDIFRVERQGNTIYFKRNGKTLQTKTVDPTEELVVDVASKTNGREFGTIRASFGEDLSVTYTQTNPSHTATGSIALTVTGGSEPAVITWDMSTIPSNGDLIALLTDTILFDTLSDDSIFLVTQPTTQTGLKAGKYLVKVYSGSETFEETIFLSADRVWAAENGVTISNQSEVTKTGTNGWTSGKATLANYFDSDADNHLQFELDQTNAQQAVGLRLHSASQAATYQDLDFAFFIDNDEINVWGESTLYTALGTYQDGDELSIDLVGQTLEFRQSGTLLKSFTISTHKLWYPEVLIYDNGAKIKNIYVDAPYWNEDQVVLDASTCSPPYTGSVTFPALDLLSSAHNNLFNNHSYVWTDENGLVVGTSLNLYGVPAGTYTLTHTHTNLLNQTAYIYVQSFTVDYELYWTDQVQSTTLAGDLSTLEKNAATSAWDAGGASANRLEVNANGWTEFTIPNASGNYKAVFGFNQTNSNTTPSDIDFGFTVIKSGSNWVYSRIPWTLNPVLNPGSGLQLAMIPAHPCQPGDVLRMTRENGTIKYYVNGVEINQTNTPLPPNTQWPTNIQALTNNNQELIADAAIFYDDNQVFRGRASFGCLDEKIYATLKKELDGSYYTAKNRKVYFRYDEEYADSDQLLTYTLYDDFHQPISLAGVTMPAVWGSNFNLLDFMSQPQVPGGFYVLEVKNEKEETWFLRFKL